MKSLENLPDLTPSQQKKLDIAIKESFDKKNWISEKDADKQIDLWLATNQ